MKEETLKKQVMTMDDKDAKDFLVSQGLANITEQQANCGQS